MVGKIAEFQAIKNTATIEVMSKMAFVDGEVLEYPLLTDCPVFVLQGQGAYVNMPVGAGDYCIVLFNDRSLDDWWVSGKPMAPTITHTHSLSDGIALVGVQPLTKLLAIDAAKFGLRGGGKKISISNDLADLKTQLDAIMALIDKLASATLVEGSSLKIIVGSYIADKAAIDTALGNLMEAGA